MLVEMGFTAAQASHALEVCDGNPDDAYDFLCSPAEAVSSSQDETQTAAMNSSDELDALVGMGFDSTKARQALDATDGQIDDAVQYLLSGRGKPEQRATPKKKLVIESHATTPGALFCAANTPGKQ